jgi:hypothetical protein
LDLAIQNLLSPMVLFFALGLAAASARSDLNVPDSVAKLLALYLLMVIGFKGGVQVALNGPTFGLIATILAGIALSFIIPVIAYGLLTKMSKLSPVDAASIAAHYGSISAVTFAAVTGSLSLLGLPYEGYMAAVAAAMETPAIFSALIIARRADGVKQGPLMPPHLLREVALNGSIVMLLGAFVIGIATGERGYTALKPFLTDLFPGFLCLFLLDMGLVAGRGLGQGRKYLSPAVVGFAVLMPFIGAALAALLARMIGLSIGGTAVFMTLAASASYIAVPAAMRLALPQANPAIALTLSLGVTFPFNLIIGIPLYIALAKTIAAP